MLVAMAKEKTKGKKLDSGISQNPLPILSVSLLSTVRSEVGEVGWVKGWEKEDATKQQRAATTHLNYACTESS